MALAPPVGLFPFSNSHLASVFTAGYLSPVLGSPSSSFLTVMGVTPDALIMLAKACPQLHSLDIQHSMVSLCTQRLEALG